MSDTGNTKTWLSVRTVMTLRKMLLLPVENGTTSRMHQIPDICCILSESRKQSVKSYFKQNMSDTDKRHQVPEVRQKNSHDKRVHQITQRVHLRTTVIKVGTIIDFPEKKFGTSGLEDDLKQNIK